MGVRGKGVRGKQEWIIDTRPGSKPGSPCARDCGPSACPPRGSQARSASAAASPITRREINADPCRLAGLDAGRWSIAPSRRPGRIWTGNRDHEARPQEKVERGARPRRQIARRAHRRRRGARHARARPAVRPDRPRARPGRLGRLHLGPPAAARPGGPVQPRLDHAGAVRRRRRLVEDRARACATHGLQPQQHVAELRPGQGRRFL